MKNRIIISLFLLFTIIFLSIFVPRVDIFQIGIFLKNIIQFFAWSESSRDYWLAITQSREFVFLAFFGKDVFVVFFNLGIFRIVTLPVLKSQRILSWFVKLRLVRKIFLYKCQLVNKANSGLLSWKIVFFTILFVLSVIPVPYFQTVAVGLYILAFFTERNFAKLLGHYAFYALLVGSFLKYIIVIYTKVFDNLFFVQF